MTVKLKIGENKHDNRSYHIGNILGRYFRDNNISVINENRQALDDLYRSWTYTVGLVIWNNNGTNENI